MLRYACSSLWLSVAFAGSLAACTADDSFEPPAATQAAETTAGAAAQAQPASAVIQLGASPAQLETIGAARGGVALDATVLSSQVTSPGVVTAVHASFVETIETRPDGIEQSWSFEHAPGAVGELEVIVGTSGIDYLSTTSEGLEFRRPGEIDVRYSHGVWIEANGNRTPVAARYDRGQILLTVPTSLVAHSAYPAVLDPRIIVTPIIR